MADKLVKDGKLAFVSYAERDRKGYLRMGCAAYRWK